jgi:hypothetical protein
MRVRRVNQGCVKRRLRCEEQAAERRLWALALDEVLDGGADVEETAERLGLSEFVLRAAVAEYEERFESEEE